MPKKLALLIGSRNFEDPSLARLSAPWDDVEKLGSVLRETGGFEVDKHADLGLDDIREAIQRHFQEAEKDDTLLLYYTGHGLRDTNGHDLYLALRRTKTDVLRSTSLDAAFIRREMQLSRSQRQILIFDCCHSGAFMDGSDTAKRGDQTLTESDVLEPGGTGRYVLAASAANESAFERNGASIYTEFMVEALRTGAAAPEKSEVTVDDLHDYLVQRVGADTVPMRPHIWKSAANEPLVIARNPDPRKPIPQELVSGLFDRDKLRAQGAIAGLLRLRGEPDPRLAEDAEKILRDRLRKTDDLLADVADSIREGLGPEPDTVTPLPDVSAQRAGRSSYLPWAIAAVSLGLTGVTAFALWSELQEQANGTGVLRAEIADLEQQVGELRIVADYARDAADQIQSDPSDLADNVTSLQTEVSRLTDVTTAQQESARLAGEKFEALSEERDDLNTAVAQLEERLKNERDLTEALRIETEALQEKLEAAQEPDNPPDGQPPLTVFQDCNACPEMVVIPSGTFTMGSPEVEDGRDTDEGPLTDVTVDAFALAKTEVTFDQWLACVDGGGCRSNARPDDEGWGEADRPVINVSWSDAQDYVAWLNGQVDGDPYRLPSEAEWEYAARATTVSGVPGPVILGGTVSVRASEEAYPWGRFASREHANYNGVDGADEWTNSAPVGRFEANGFGLHDMHGNVWEWVEDCWHDDYAGAPTDGSAWLSETGGHCTRRVVRGGSWGNDLQSLRSANRYRIGPDVRGFVLGFRPARTHLPLSP